MQKSNSSVGLTINSDSGIQLLPTSFIRGGYYYYSRGDIINRNIESFYLEPGSYSAVGVQFLYSSSIYLNPQSGNDKGRGFSLRCLIR